MSSCGSCVFRLFPPSFHHESFPELLDCVCSRRARQGTGQSLTHLFLQMKRWAGVGCWGGGRAATSCSILLGVNCLSIISHSFPFSSLFFCTILGSECVQWSNSWALHECQTRYSRAQGLILFRSFFFFSFSFSISKPTCYICVCLSVCVFECLSECVSVCVLSCVVWLCVGGHVGFSDADL